MYKPETHAPFVHKTQNEQTKQRKQHRKLKVQFFISTTYTQYRVKGYKQTINGSNTYTNNSYYTQTNKKAVSQY